MKYLVVSTLDIEDKVEARCDTYEEAYEELLDRFFDYQRSCGYSEEDIKSIYEQIESGDLSRQDCGIIMDDYPCFWSDSNPKCKYDIKIIDQF